MIKSPRSTTATELLERMRNAERAMQRVYFDELEETPSVLETTLDANGSSLVQEKFGEKDLSSMTREEIKELGTKTKLALIDLLLCSELMRQHTGNFIDLCGYDDHFGGIRKILRAINPRYSTNIRVNKTGDAKLIDCDWHFREGRSLLRRLGAWGLTPVISHYTKKFRTFLINSL